MSDTPAEIVLDFGPFQEVDLWRLLLEHPALKSLLPFPIVGLILPCLWWLFRGTWKQLDQEATRERVQMAERGEFDYRPVACLVLAAMILTVQEYYGGRRTFEVLFRPELAELEKNGMTFIKLAKYEQLYGFVYWSMTRVAGYLVVPIIAWRWWFPQDNLLDYGLRTQGFFKHLWIYGGLLVVIVPVMFIVAQQSDFGSYYPFYKLASRSWFDLLAWESVYWLQFFSLEFFFRGWMVGALRRSMGAAAIVAMAVPYCMIHYGKPYLEAHGAIIAGLVLGSLSMKTRSIYSGFLLHISVAVGMDLLSLFKRDALPTVFWAGG